MGFWRFQVTHNVDSLNPLDAIVNTFHFDSDQSFADDADDIVGRLETFYVSLQSIFHFSMAGTATVKVYDLEDPEPRPPKLTDTIAYTPSTNTVIMPGEVAICASYKALPEAGIPPGRLRGRIFLGRISNAVMANDGNGNAVLTATNRQLVADALEGLCTGPDPGDGRLAVFSPTIAGPPPWTAAELDAAFHDVATVWVDNAFDTIRSRGIAPTARTTLTVT